MPAARTAHAPHAPLLLVLLFLGALLAPWIDTLARPELARDPQVEGRRAEAWPEWSWREFLRANFLSKVELAFGDHLGLRDVLLRANSRLRLEGWGASPSPAVLLGRAGWMFYTGEDSLPIARGLAPFDEAQLALWQRVLERRRDRARELGARYLFVIGPNKESIYPDYLPEGWEALGPTRLDQLAQWLGAHSDLEFVDLRPVLRAARADDTPEHHLYYEEGTHWHGRGCLVASREVLRRMAAHFPAMAELAPTPWRLSSTATAESWRTKMYLDPPAARLRDEWRQDELRRALPHATEGSTLPRFEQREPRAGLPRVVMFHDSFGPGLARLLAEDCAALACRQENELDATLVESEGADLVLDVYVERVLAIPNPRIFAGPPGARFVHRNEHPDARFDESRDVRLACGASTALGSLGLSGGLEVEARTSPPAPGLLLRSSGSSGLLTLPELAPGAPRDLVLRMELHSSRATQAELFYRAEDEGWSAGQSLGLELQRGSNEIEVFLAASEHVRELRLRPGRAPLRCLVRSLEVRAVGGP